MGGRAIGTSQPQRIHRAPQNQAELLRVPLLHCYACQACKEKSLPAQENASGMSGPNILTCKDVNKDYTKVILIHHAYQCPKKKNHLLTLEEMTIRSDMASLFQ
jgi:hypothetical protein